MKGPVRFRPAALQDVQGNSARTELGDAIMGEYAKFQGARVKIGTCEDMYYLRYDQRHLVEAERGNVNPNSSRDVHSLRFRFPWPDEDTTARPGFDDADHRYERSVHVPSLTVPEGVKHGSIQFAARAGYLVSLPCPEGPGSVQGFTTIVNGLTVHRNGFSGTAHLCQQKLLQDGRLVPIMRCGGCGTKYRVEEPADIEALVVALRAEGDRRAKDGAGDWWQTIADRVEAGASSTVEG